MITEAVLLDGRPAPTYKSIKNEPPTDDDDDDFHSPNLLPPMSSPLLHTCEQLKVETLQRAARIKTPLVVDILCLVDTSHSKRCSFGTTWLNQPWSDPKTWDRIPRMEIRVRVLMIRPPPNKNVKSSPSISAKKLAKVSDLIVSGALTPPHDPPSASSCAHARHPTTLDSASAPLYGHRAQALKIRSHISTSASRLLHTVPKAQRPDLLWTSSLKAFPTMPSNCCLLGQLIRFRGPGYGWTCAHYWILRARLRCRLAVRCAGSIKMARW